MASNPVKDYFKRFYECINLEQSAEMDRQQSQYNQALSKETNLRMTSITTNCMEGVMVTLQKPKDDNKISELSERQFVNLKTTNNISFWKICWLRTSTSV